MRSLITAAAIAVVGTGAIAQELPDQIAWTAYGTTSSGYAQSIGLGNMLKSKYDVDLRVIPGKNDVSRMLPLKAGQAEICACGIASYFGQEGVFMFADDRWGPTKLYNLFNNLGRNGQGIMVAADAGVKTISDLKGKRVTWTKGAPALNVNTTAGLAFGGLTWDDVDRIVVPGWGQSMQAVIDGQADAAWGSTISSVYNQIAASPRGLFHPTFPHDDKEAWERAQAVGPHWSPQMVSNAVNGESNTSGEMPFEGMNYPYPIFVGMENLSSDLAYNLTKAIMENYETFKDSGPGMDGYQLKNQNLEWIFPYQEGAIAYYKEAGVWSDEAQAAQEANLERQDVLATAWEEFQSMDVSEDEYEAKWLDVRAKHLEEAEMQAPFSEPLLED